MTLPLTQYRERPQCRKVIEKILKEKNITLEGLQVFDKEHYYLSDELRRQLRKMIQEQNK